MKREYPRYNATTEDLTQVLTSRDRAILHDFLQFCRMTASEDRVTSKYQRFLLHFRDVVEKPFDSVTKQDAIAFWGLVKNAPYSEHTIIAIRKVVRRFLKWHFHDPEMIEPLKIPGNYLVNKNRVNKAALLSQQELQQMVHRAEKIRDKCLLILLYETAARPQEIRDLKWGDVNFELQEVHLYSRKTKEDRDLPISEALKHLQRWKAEWVFPDPDHKDFIFPSTIGSRSNRRKPISVAYINLIIKRLARKVGIQRDVYPYLLRHTRLTEIRRRGVQGIEFNKFAGHAPGSKHENVYVHLDNEDMRKTILEKVYKVQELSAPERDKYEQRITELESQIAQCHMQIRNVISFLQESRNVMIDAQGQLESQI
ncbi:tyrosine-type recombinase/integrase [Bythopirellula polymerisocia]|uniref:Tyrosine recombinase XerC n=1 Tax=Bythopirellula polymerisocia TaxID=2528003 RepID=A0A5C6CDC3_9BACT|nr:tyrosine-type recombinase/integrase [Bythopirellula polymerisocia]TWU21421.1 Tyrosine recombinase XerC [Bythopirellula polymerisocia]